jgi:hypothetical protein
MQVQTRSLTSLRDKAPVKMKGTPKLNRYPFARELMPLVVQKLQSQYAMFPYFLIWRSGVPKNFANANETPYLANSAGCKLKLPDWNPVFITCNLFTQNKNGNN